tara:strand:- start:319 stop:480 length:162 start_codon:yes stop_codon:yes gene_type:complete
LRFSDFPPQWRWQDKLVNASTFPVVGSILGGAVVQETMAAVELVVDEAEQLRQ